MTIAQVNVKKSKSSNQNTICLYKPTIHYTQIMWMSIRH